MKITEKSKISDLINHDEGVIDIIAAINKNFKKLKNPILRKVLAPRVNIAQAAKIGGVSPSVILQSLERLGFELDNTKPIEQNEKPIQENKQEMKHMETITLDVRPILENGTDPFQAIMAQLKTMNDDQALMIINTFEPIPLLNILKDKGYSYDTSRPAENEVHTLLFKNNDFEEEPKQEIKRSDLSFEQAEKKFSGRMSELDVRDLEMPLPMVSILEAIEKITEKDALYVHHKKLPQYLIPELENRSFSFVSNEIDESNIKLIIFKS